jgi:hypothetical protein
LGCIPQTKKVGKAVAVVLAMLLPWQCIHPTNCRPSLLRLMIDLSIKISGKFIYHYNLGCIFCITSEDSSIDTRKKQPTTATMIIYSLIH